MSGKNGFFLLVTGCKFIQLSAVLLYIHKYFFMKYENAYCLLA